LSYLFARGASGLGGGGGGVLGAAKAPPQRGRLVVFLHEWPHAGLPVLDMIKTFLRGELAVS
jgi:hypothetical protein